MPSLEQLDQAVREFIAENPGDEVTVVVDASFGHRIDPSEVPAFEAAEAAGEVISPPAGAIGRGDAFLLRIAEKTGATVLSNDSFQEFHGEHSWLFEKGRLIGGKPVPGIGWIFMDRTPVRGAKSREVVKEAKRRKRAETEEAPAVKGAAEKPARSRPKAVDRAIARATQEVVEPKAGGEGKSRRRRGGAPPAEPVNEPLAFITFIAAHPLGSEVVGAVIEYSSHGAFIEADGARCYIPLSAMADPPPRKAREVVTKGESVNFVVQAFDPQRRGIELALPGFAHLAGAPTAETVEAEISGEAKPAPKGPRRRGARAPQEAEAPAGPAEVPAAEAGEETAPAAPVPARRPRRAPPAREAAAAPVAEEAAPTEAVTEAPSRRRRAVKAAAPAETAVPAEELPAPVRKAGPRRSPARTAGMRAPSGLPAAAEVPPAPARRTTRKAAGAAAAPEAPVAPETAVEEVPAAPARKAPARKVAARRAPAGTATPEPAAAEAPAAPTPARKKAPARKVGAEKAPPAKAPARKAAASKAPAGKVAPDKAAPAKAPARKAAAAKAATAKAPAGKAAAEKAPARKAPARKAGGGGDVNGQGGEQGSPAKRPSGRRKAGTEAG